MIGKFTFALLALLAAGCAATPPLGSPPGPDAAAAETPDCGTQIPVTEAVVRDASAMNPLQAVAGDILIGDLHYLREPAEAAEAASGSVLFFKLPNGGWRAVLPANRESVLGVFLGRGLRDVLVVTQLQIEGPGQSFTLARSGDRFAHVRCAEVPFPEMLNNPQWMLETLTLFDVDIDRKGRGALIGSAALDRPGETPRTVWFAYDTGDDGRTWSPPRALPGQPQPPSGVFIQAVEQDAPALAAELQAYARGK